MHKGRTIGGVIPAYNEEVLITETLKSVPDFVDKVYVVNDGSTDRTAEIIQSFNQNRIHFINHSKNQGVGAALVSGYKQVIEDNIDIAVVLAGDNQMDATHIVKLTTPIIEGTADYTKGDRLSRPGYNKGMSTWRFFGNWLLTLLTKIASGYWKIRDPQNGYTAITREALQQIDLDRVYPGYGYCNDLLVKLDVAGCKVTDVPIPARYGEEISKL